jgi:hypothetical protein
MGLPVSMKSFMAKTDGMGDSLPILKLFSVKAAVAEVCDGASYWGLRASAEGDDVAEVVSNTPDHTCKRR